MATKARKGTAIKVGKGKVRGNGEGGVWQIPDDAKRHAGKWRCTVELGYKADGTRVRRNLIAASKAEILVKLAAAKSDAVAPTSTAPKDLTVAKFLEDWLDTLELAGLAPRTIEQRRLFTRLYLVPEIGRDKLVDLKPEDVEKMLRRLATRPGRPLSPRTLQLVRCILGTALTRAEKFGYVAGNAAKLSTAPKSTSKKRDAYTADEVKLLLRTAGGSRIGRVVELIALTGLRRGELGALRWSNVNFDKGLITVDGTLAKDLSVGATKTRSSQGSISLPPAAVELLRAQARHQADDMNSVSADVWEERGFVFTTGTGGPLNGDHLARDFTALCKKAEVRCLGLHALRHTFATLALKAGIPLIVVSRTLRHASITITANQYAHVVPELQEEAVNAVAGAIAGWR